MLSNPRSLFVGEVLQVAFDGANKSHSMIVTSKNASDIYLTYNSTNTLNRSFSSLVADYPRARWFPHLVHTSF
jgi:hypothetical protein